MYCLLLISNLIFLFFKEISSVNTFLSKIFSNNIKIQKYPSKGVLKKSVLKICSKFTGKHPCRSVFSIKLQSNFIEITLRHGCSSVNLLHFFRTPFLNPLITQNGKSCNPGILQHSVIFY